MTTYNLSKLVASNTAKYNELNEYLQTKRPDAYIVTHNTTTNEISILGQTGAALNIYTNADGRKYSLITKYPVFFDDVLNMIPKSNSSLSAVFTELLVYSTKYKVSQYFTNVSINDVMSQFKTRLKNDTIQITDFTFVDVINNKTLTIKPIIKVVDYIVE